MENSPTKPKNKRKTPKKKSFQSRNLNLCSQELRDRETELKRELETLNEQIRKFEEEGVTTDVSNQMTALHEYNEMKDMTQVVLSYLSNATQESIVDLHKKYNLPLE
ncbi:hypothetical protein HHI36_005786 [Cryptolaemus montrouzieri]|uniref:DNA repair protein SWI5 homolog n=1 Tax=Cryptolaemus montrouzieri TaxID=559131 RepID=A0ABD2NW52_9CUCU